MTYPSQRQHAEGEPAIFITKGGEQIPLHALDFSGRELPLYVEKQKRNPETGQLPAKEPNLFCPSCGNNLLADNGVNGPNSQRGYICETPEGRGCKMSWSRAQNMLRGIGLVME